METIEIKIKEKEIPVMFNGRYFAKSTEKEVRKIFGKIARAIIVVPNKMISVVI